MLTLLADWFVLVCWRVLLLLLCRSVHLTCIAWVIRIASACPCPLPPPCQVFNPPYVPTPDEEMARGGIAAAWAGGARGRAVTDRLLPCLPRLLSLRGEVFMVAVHENDPPGGCW